MMTREAVHSRELIKIFIRLLSSSAMQTMAGVKQDG